MLAILLKARLSALFHTLFSGNKKKRTIPMIVLFALLFLYLGVALLFVFVGLFALLLPPLLEAGVIEVYFAIGGALAFLVMLIGNVYFTKNQLYTADDNEFLLAMPIPPRTILVSRLILVILTSFLFEAAVALPMLAVYLFLAKVQLTVVLSMLLVFLALPFLTQSVSAFLAYLLARASARIRRKNLLTTLLSLLFLGVYFLSTYGIEALLEWLSGDITPLVRFVTGFWPLAALGNAMAGKAVALLGFLLAAAAVTVLTLHWLSRSFIRTVLENKGAPTVRYREKTVKPRSPLYALTVRELRHLGSSPAWMMNTGIGLLFALIPPVYLLIDGSILAALASGAPLLLRLLPALAGAIGAACLSMVCFSAVTVSLEGRTYWLVRTLPVPTRTVLLSKILLHVVPTAPVALLTGVLFAIVLGAPVTLLLMLPVFLLCYTLTSAAVGLAANLLFPKMEWKNEVVPIKQGGASLLAMLGNAVCAALGSGAAVLLSLVIPAPLALFGGALVLLAIFAVLLWCILNVGVRQFESL